LFRVTTPGRVYAELSRMVLAREPGERLPSYQQAMADLGATQRSLDMAYAQLQEDGAVEARKRRGMFVINPYAGGTVLFLMRANNLMPGQGEGVRQQYLITRSLLAEYFPGASLELVVTDYIDERHEAELRSRLALLDRHRRLIGLIGSYHVVDVDLQNWLKERRLVLTDVGNPLSVYTLPGGGLETPLRMGVDHLRDLGWKRIVCVTAAHVHGDETPAAAARKLEACLLKEARDVPLIPVHTPAHTSSQDSAREAVKTLIRRSGLPDAMIFLNDYVYRGFSEGAYECGIDLTANRALVVYTSEGFRLHASRPVTRVEIPRSRVAREQCRIIRDVLRGNPNPEPRRIDPVLKPGQTSISPSAAIAHPAGGA